MAGVVSLCSGAVFHRRAVAVVGRHAGAEEESWMEIGSKYVVFYSDDDDVWHERYLLLLGGEERHFLDGPPMMMSTRRT